MTLGQGLQSLIPPKKGYPGSSHQSFKKDYKEPVKTRGGDTLYIEVRKIKNNPYQPRKNFDRARLQELADSIREHGILQPLVVTPASPAGGKTGEDYQLIAGERRLEAAKIIGLSEVPIIIRDSTEQEKLELALVENLQRDNLNPIEKAYAFKKLIDEFNFVQQDIAKRIGKSRETVANTLRLLDLPAEIQRAILENKITEGHGRAILALPNIEKQLLLFKEILRKKLSVRQAETMAQKFVKSSIGRVKLKSKKDSYLREREDKLSNILGTRVKLTQRGQKGKIIIEFFSQEELNNIIKRICRTKI